MDELPVYDPEGAQKYLGQDLISRLQSLSAVDRPTGTRDLLWFRRHCLQFHAGTDRPFQRSTSREERRETSDWNLKRNCAARGQPAMALNRPRRTHAGDSCASAARSFVFLARRYVPSRSGAAPACCATPRSLAAFSGGETGSPAPLDAVPALSTVRQPRVSDVSAVRRLVGCPGAAPAR